MKRTTVIFLTALILIIALTACSEKSQDSSVSNSSFVRSENDIYVNNPSSSDYNGFGTLNNTIIEQFIKQADIFSNQLLLSSLLFEEYNFNDIVIIENLSDIEIYRFLMSMYSYNDNAEYPYNNLSVQENTGFSVISNESAQYVVNEFFGIENWSFDINDEGFDFYDSQAQEYKSQRDLGGRNNNITLSNIASQYESSNSSIISQVTISTGSMGEDGNNPKPLAVLKITFNIVIENDKAHLQFHKVENIIN